MATQNSTSSVIKTSTPWYKNYMVAIFVIGLPAVVVVACIFFVFFSVKHKDATVRDDWYMDGKTLYQDASKDQLAHDLGAHGVMRFDGDVVTFELNFAKPVDSDAFSNNLSVRISHATDPKKDHDFTLTRIKDNLYQGKIALNFNEVRTKYYININDDQHAWRLTQVQKLPAQNVIFQPLSAFDEVNQTLPDQRNKRFNATPNHDTKNHTEQNN